MFDTLLTQTYYYATIAESDRDIPSIRVTKNQHSRSLEYVPFSRAVSLLLLILVIYGTAVEAAHRHGRILGSADPAQVFSVSNTDDSKGLINVLVGCSDCLICQLHQHFATSLVTVRHSSSPPRTDLKILHPTFGTLRSRTNTTQTGRAPPFTS